MSDDKLEALRKRMADRQDAVSRSMNQNFGARMSSPPASDQSSQNINSEQASLQDENAMAFEAANAETMAAHLGSDPENRAPTGRPPAPTGKWRCISNSPVVSIDLIANIAEGGGLSAQGTVVYVATSRIYEVSGQGSWTLMPPDHTSPNWLFNFRLIPSNHAIFRWFASPTDSPNHLHNRFVSPRTGHVIDTRCERIG
ncbi:hypothetical protein WNY37_17100 [Henriciella sp. AS95]|uniref:hypothetical protein n=1 Tax=Henriciella sp. AS95 TaxID=3135782 RepID=UPI00316D4070